MLDRVIRRQNLIALLDELRPRFRLIGPVRRDLPRANPPYRHLYEPVTSAAHLDLGFAYCEYSPKWALFPPRETLFTFERERGRFEAHTRIDAQPTALIGVHPCDVHAIRLLDRVFEADPPDAHYLARRAATFIIAIDCIQPCHPTAFCADMHTNEVDEGPDLLLIPLDGADAPHTGKHAPEIGYGVICRSNAGSEWINEPVGRNHWQMPSAADERAFERYQAAKQANFKRRISTPHNKLPELLDRSYDSLLWEATARRCYSCGSCNLVCPTCYCFDIRDENELDPKLGRRVRVWDSCQLREFAVVAGPHNFRPKASSRLRHRMYRKGSWIRQRHGLAGCVGCGRCDRACTARINSVDIYNQLAEEV